MVRRRGEETPAPPTPAPDPERLRARLLLLRLLRGGRENARRLPPEKRG